MRPVAHLLTHENLKHHMWKRTFSPPMQAKAGTHWTHFDLFAKQKKERRVFP
jgi:hypothetical protein